MKDFFNRDLSIGDRVVIVCPGYRGFVIGEVIAFTPKQVRVSYTNTWNFGPGGRAQTLLQSPNQLIKTDFSK